MSDFGLDNSRWYSLMKLGLACRNAKVCAEEITTRVPKLAKFDYEPSAGKELADAEDALTEALLAVQVARASYERATLQAAE